MNEQAERRRQCAKCPWKKGVDPRDIPGGYSEKKHRGLRCTIADPGAISAGGLKMMACHETTGGNELPCVGWLAHQLGPGNNLGLRLAVITGKVSGAFDLVGEQHERFEDTLPPEGIVTATLCASHIATGIVRARSGRAPVLCDALVPDDVDACPSCGCESPATRARLVVHRMAHYYETHGRGTGDVEKTVERMSWTRGRFARP